MTNRLLKWNLAPDICPEVRLLLACARTCIDHEKTEQIKALLQEEINWMRFIKLAHSHRMMSLLHNVLNTTHPEYVSQIAMFLFQDYFQTNTQRNQTLVRELLTILDLFETHEVPVFPYKGPVLAYSLYHNPALRDCGDVDLLIRKRDVAKARNLLSQQGYYLSQRDVPDEQQAVIFRYKHSYNLFRDSLPVSVDLHWKFTNHSIPFNLDLEGLWEYLEPLSFAGRTVLFPSPEILLILLCVHGAKHFNPWERLVWVCDIARSIEVYQEIDWQRVLKHAEQFGSVRMLFVGLLLANDLLGIGVPEEISSRVEDDPIARILALQVSKWMFSEDERATQYDKKAIPNLLFHLRMRERMRDRVSSFSRLAHRKLSFDAPYRASFATLPWKAFPSLLFYTFYPHYDGFGRHPQR